MDQVASGAGGVAAVVLTLIALLHVAWAFGARWGRAAVLPSSGGQPTMNPGPALTLAVAVALLVAADLYMGAATGRSPEWLFRTGSVVVALVLAARVVGDRRTFGLTRQVHDTEFARRDALIFTPLAAVLAVAGLLVAAT